MPAGPGLTNVYKRYLVILIFRIAVFLAVLYAYIFHKDLLTAFMNQPISLGISPIHVLWAVFMISMIIHLFPGRRAAMGILKQKEELFDPDPAYSELGLLRYVQSMNIRAWVTMFVWLSFNAIFGILYLYGVLDETDLLMLTVFYFLSDYICIIVYCPFQTFILRNKCCVNCRIYDWGHFMMFTPMLFIKNFFSWSLFFTSIVVLFRWEMIYARHPERFWEGSNRALRCADCRDRTCLIKKSVARHFVKSPGSSH